MVYTILAGVGGTGGWSALAWAADEAAAAAAQLIVCRVCPPTSPLLDGGRGRPCTALIELADPPLARAVTAVRSRLGGQRVAVMTSTGRPGSALARAAATADLLVVGVPSRRHGYGGTAHHLAAHSPCPVVMVRAVDSARAAPFAGHVVIGVDGAATGRAALEFGFGYASLHRLPLAAAHVSGQRREDYWYDDDTLSTHFPVEPAELELLAAEVEPWTHQFPHVWVKRVVLAGPTTHALVRGAVGARLLVLGARRRGHVAQVLTGGTTAAVIAQAPGPVAVVPADEVVRHG